MIKIYRATTRLAFPVVAEGKKKYVMFSDDKNSFSTSDEKVQEYIENSPHFKRKEITLFKKIGSEKISQVNVDQNSEISEAPEDIVIANDDITPYPDVTDINGAVAVLKGEPYKVHHMKLKNPAAILEQAKLNNVSFPNWTQE